MTDALERLIEAVAAGTLTGDCPTAYADGMIEMIERSGVCRRSDWDDVALAHDGSLDAALSFLDALLPTYDWGRAPQGQMWVRTQGGPFVWSGDGYPPARGLLLAILRAYAGERVSETADR